MKNQIYIILSIFIVFSSCKEDSPIHAPDDIFYWDISTNKYFHRADTIIDVKSKIIPPFKVVFANLSSGNGKTTNYKLYFDGGDTLLFLKNDCDNRPKTNTYLDENLDYTSKIVIDEYKNGNSICNNDSIFYIGFKRIYKNNHGSNFGWMKIAKPLQGYWIIDDFAYNLGNHRPIYIGQKE